MATATKRKPRAAKARYFKGVGATVARFGEKNIIQTKGRWAGQPLRYEPWEREVLDELYLVDAEGKRVYREGIIGVARKNGKSTLVTSITIRELVASGESSPEVYAAAAAQDQARIVFGQACAFVRQSPRLSPHLKPQRSVILCAANDGIFRVLSADADVQHGLNPSCSAVDELHAHRDGGDLYYALSTAMLAREQPLMISITTAGYDRETICWDVYDHGRELAAKGQDALRKAGFFFHWLAAPPEMSISDRKGWRMANPSSWVTEELLAREYARLPESVFRRLHLNQWTESLDSWISPDDWDACAGRPRIDRSKPTWFGIDIGLKRDATATVWCQWHGEKLHVKHDIRLPKEGQPLSATENRARLASRAAEFAAVREIAYDPWSFRESAEELTDRGLPMVEFDQTAARMAPASEHLYELVKEHRLVHDGSPRFRRQVLAAVASETERGWRISKRKSRERIDAAVALAMAAERAIASKFGPKFDLADYRIESL